MREVVTREKEIAFFIKLFPLKSDKKSYETAKSIQCRKSLKLLEDAFLGREIPHNPKCPAGQTEIDNNIKLAGELRIKGVPGLIMESGRVFGRFLTSEQIIKEARR